MWIFLYCCILFFYFLACELWFYIKSLSNLLVGLLYRSMLLWTGQLILIKRMMFPFQTQMMLVILYLTFHCLLKVFFNSLWKSIIVFVIFVVLGISRVYGRNWRASCLLSTWRWLFWVCLILGVWTLKIH